MKGRTKDEKFVVCLYEAAKEAGSLDTPFDRYEIGKKIGINTRTVDTICRLLTQANFIRHAEGAEIYLTENGIRLAESFY